MDDILFSRLTIVVLLLILVLFIIYQSMKGKYSFYDAYRYHSEYKTIKEYLKYYRNLGLKKDISRIKACEIEYSGFHSYCNNIQIASLLIIFFLGLLIFDIKVR